MSTLEIRLLGPMELVREGTALPLESVRLRTLLALLLVNREHAVTVDRLIEELRLDGGPAAPKTIQVYISRLRKIVGPDVIQTSGRGYRIDPSACSVDVDRFEELVRSGRFEDGLALWRGTTVGDGEFDDLESLRLESFRLGELRLAAVEAELERRVGDGSDVSAIAELKQLAQEHPLRERPRALLMLTLYRAGRQAEALDVYRELRRRLRDEVGLEPSTELQDLQQQILNHDPVLRPRVAAARLARSRGTYLLVTGGVLLLATVVAAAVIVRSNSGSVFIATAVPNSVIAIDPSANRIVRLVRSGQTPEELAASANSVFVLNHDDRTVTQISTSGQTSRTFAAGENVGSIAVAGGSLWAIDASGSTLSKLDLSTSRVERSLDLPPPRPGIGVAAANMVGDRTTIWINGDAIGPVQDPHSLIWRIPTSANRIRRPRSIAGSGSTTMTVGAGSVWIRTDTGLVRLNEKTDAAQGGISIPWSAYTTEEESGVAFGAGSLWAASAAGGVVWRIDPLSMQQTASIIAGSPHGVAYGAGSVWIADSASNRILRVDPASNRITAIIPTGTTPNQLLYADGRVWASVD